MYIGPGVSSPSFVFVPTRRVDMFIDGESSWRWRVGVGVGCVWSVDDRFLFLFLDPKLKIERNKIQNL